MQPECEPSAVANAASIPSSAMVKGCTLASFAAYSGWNFECSGDGTLAVYRCGKADVTRRRIRLNAALAGQVRQIEVETNIDDPERTRAVLRLFKSACVAASAAHERASSRTETT